MKSSSNSEAPAGGTKDKIKLALFGVAVALVLGTILYFVGLKAGRAQLAAQEAKFGVERNGLQSKVTTAEAERDTARERTALMEARAALYRTAIDLESANFGTANSHLKEAASALGKVQKLDIELLRQQISATDINIAVNAGQQRAKVLGFAEQLNKKMPAETETTAPTVATSPDDAAMSPLSP